MTTLGVVFLPQNPPETLPAVARAAGAAGLEELWLWEDCFLGGGVSSVAAALASSTHVRVGLGVMPVPLRNVALVAMEIATLCRMFGDRVMPGVGHGVQDWMAQVGARPASPMTLLREYVTALQALLRGDMVTTEGRYVRLDGVRLDWPPDPAPPLWLGATGPKTLRLSGELAHGTILSGGTSPELTARARELTGGHPLAVFVPAATGPGAEQRLAALTLDHPGVHGDAAQIADAVMPWIEAGATSVILQPTPDEPDLPGFIRFVAEQVRPKIPRA
ncbi:LLM class flavin-dependent oxidoreductase [Mangrovihabitans endophyticus]|uniref:Oxidoreductase n=1 Tax=Mangrovihabitans endophyticus TaxID=1751298 RepID=A0A8J3C0R6_9ACTN|nr:LLM class flavin-dependent oxidoreductase [Mangrovihabitans endophyticus]GGL02249.1 oxidoreductase [Mangrovihabitans endophyticus]